MFELSARLAENMYLIGSPSGSVTGLTDNVGVVVVATVEPVAEPGPANDPGGIDLPA